MNKAETNVSVYVSVGLRSALNLPYPDETVDEEASCRKAEQVLYDRTICWSEDCTFHVDFGEGEPLCIIEHSCFPEALETDEAWIIQVVLDILKEEDWMVHRTPCLGTYAQWSGLIRTLTVPRAIEFWDEYFTYKMKKFEENAIVLTDETPVVMYVGPSDVAELVFGLEEFGIREVTERNILPPHEVTEIVYPLTALETTFENDRDIDMFRSLEKLAKLWRAEANKLFTNANIIFIPLPKEKQRVGSVSMFVDDNLLYNPFELEEAFFSLGGPLVIQPDLWYTERV